MLKEPREPHILMCHVQLQAKEGVCSISHPFPFFLKPVTPHLRSDSLDTEEMLVERKGDSRCSSSLTSIRDSLKTWPVSASSASVSPSAKCECCPVMKLTRAPWCENALGSKSPVKGEKLLLSPCSPAVEEEELDPRARVSIAPRQGQASGLPSAEAGPGEIFSPA